MDLLMDKLRSKASQYRSFGELAKAIRMSQLEKRFVMDIADRTQLQKCLDTLLQSMSVNTLQGMVERLESISRQLNLKLMAGQTGLELFISSDMFYLEVSMEPSGAIKDVKVHHEGKSEQQPCETLVRSLSKGDFEDFTAQLEGLISIYQLNAEKKVKCKAFSALCALEADLGTMWSTYSSIKDIQTVLNTSPVGILEKRRGGHTMKLTYFISPYEALAAKQELTIEYINQNQLGSYVTICLEGSAAHKLQTMPIISVMKNSGKGTPVTAQLTTSNSATLPAYFSMKLSKSQPICVDVLQQIAAITELDCPDTSEAAPLFSLISRNSSNNKVDSANNKGIFVSLPDQVHCYFMTECKGLDGIIVNSIPFTHPNHVPQILTLLRQQVVFNTLVASAVRVNDKQDLENMIMLEISALSWRQILVTFEHPLEESIATLDMDLTDLSNLSVKLYSTVNTDTEQMSKVLQRCLSIPVTMRALIKNLEKTLELSSAPVNGAFSSAPNGGIGGVGEPSPDFSGPIDPSKIKTEPGTANGRSTTFDDFSAFSSSVLDANTKVMKRKVKPKTVVDDLEIIMESSSSDSEREDLRRVKKQKTSIDPKTIATPSVTITPITSGGSLSSVLSGMGLERRPGIEIIPLSAATPTNLPSSITITPIPSDKDKKRSIDDRERKKKRKREDDSKMGPPEKVPMKSDPLSKPVSVSIKPAMESAQSPRPPSPSMRKYTSSPTHVRDKPKSNPSPKHSPAYSSPKHSPKHGSPKHTSGLSGKPSMSAIKSASGSPTPKSTDPKKSSGKEQRDRDPSRKSASSPKIKTSSVKLKQLEIGSAEISVTNISPPPLDPKCPSNSLQRNRKGSLSAVIDKLKSAQEVVDPKMAPPSPSTTITKIEPKIVVAPKTPDGIKNPTEYMVKPSLDGMKITINKTRTKDGSKGSGSKTHTGLKPGVISGPASKKPTASPKSGLSSKFSTLAGSSKASLLKPIPKLIPKGSASVKFPTDLSKKDPNKPRPLKQDKNIFKEGQRKGSPTGSREDDVLKAIKLDAGLPVSLVKPFDTKFQIPKLSARNNPIIPALDPVALPDVLESPNNNNNNNITKEKLPEKVDVKVIEVGGPKSSLDLAAGLKYQTKLDSSDRMAKAPVPNLLSLPVALTNISPKLPLTSPNLPTTSLSSITSKMDRTDDSDVPVVQTEIRPVAAEPEPPKPELPKTDEEKTASAEPTDILLDFSSSQNLQAKLAIVDKTGEKSALPAIALPATSPQNPPRSPLQLIDDDLMDEALVLRK